MVRVFFLLKELNYTFLFKVTFKVVAHPQSEFVPVVTYIIAAINNRSLTNLLLSLT